MPKKPTTEKLSAGHYRIVGIVCGGDLIYGPCGGELHVERDSDNCGGIDRDFLWETYCTECKTCDCDGWPTLAGCVANAAEFFRSPA